MGALMYKQRFQPINKSSTPDRNAAHIHYIATRPGVIYNKNNTHGLFGQLTGYGITEFYHWQQVADLVREQSQAGRNIYRSIISYTPEAAEKIDLNLRDNRTWQQLIRQQAKILARENNIQFKNLQWTAAVHAEADHPHCHIVFWDKEQDIAVNHIDPEKVNAIRRSLIRYTFADELQEYFAEKNEAATIIGAMADHAIRGIGLSDQQLAAWERTVYPAKRPPIPAPQGDGKGQKRVWKSPATKRTPASDQEQFTASGSEPVNESGKKTECSTFQPPKASRKTQALIAAEIRSLLPTLPKFGALKYMYLPEEIKAVVDATTKNILALLPALQGQIDRYVKSVVDLEAKYEARPEKMKPFEGESQVDYSKRVNARKDYFAEVERTARADAELRVKNAILKTAKDILINENETGQQMRSMKYAVNTLITELFTFFSNASQENENSVNSPQWLPRSREMTTAAMRDWVATHERDGHELD